MEDVLDVYTQPENPNYPVVCMDESSKQHIQEVRLPIPVKPGQAYRYDSEYRRNGVSNLFLFFAPLQGWREVKVTDQRTKVDWAVAMRELADVHFPNAERIIVEMDNLNTHNPSSLYEAFAPEEAKRILNRLEFHYTPKHGSWLNMAEIELSVLSQQCLDRRIPDQQKLQNEVAAWVKERNAKQSAVDWRFTTEDARIKLKRLYPSFHR